MTVIIFVLIKDSCFWFIFYFHLGLSEKNMKRIMVVSFHFPASLFYKIVLTEFNTIFTFESNRICIMYDFILILLNNYRLHITTFIIRLKGYDDIIF